MCERPASAPALLRSLRAGSASCGESLIGFQPYSKLTFDTCGGTFRIRIAVIRWTGSSPRIPRQDVRRRQFEPVATVGRGSRQGQARTAVRTGSRSADRIRADGTAATRFRAFLLTLAGSTSVRRRAEAHYRLVISILDVTMSGRRSMNAEHMEGDLVVRDGRSCRRPAMRRAKPWHGPISPSIRNCANTPECLRVEPCLANPHVGDEWTKLSEAASRPDHGMPLHR